MSINDQFLTEQIEKDHEQIHVVIKQIELLFENQISKKSFFTWKIELRRLLKNFQTMLYLHFELEEELGFNHIRFLSDKEHIKTIRAFKAEHTEMLADLSDIIELQKELENNDELRLNLLNTKIKQLIHDIQKHEDKEKKLTSNTIAEFKDAGRYANEPTHTVEQIEKWEKELGFPFPDSWKWTVTFGSYDKETFHFINPFRDEAHPRFVIFAQWNAVKFGFDSEAVEDSEPPIYVLMDNMQPEKKYSDFTTWFHLVFELANRPTISG